MKHMMAFVCAAATALLMTTTAAAEEETVDKTEYIFTDENVVGGVLGTEGATITVRPMGQGRSLIKVRRHFVPEMLKAVETI